MKLLDKFLTIFDRFITLLARCASFLFIGVMLIVCFEIFMRYFLNRPQTWVVEVAEFSLLFITFFSITWLLREEAHVKIEMVVDYISEKNMTLLNIITSIICSLTCLVMAIYGTQATWMAFKLGRTTRTAMMLKQWPLLIIMPIGFFLLFLQFLRRTQNYYKEWEEIRSQYEPE